MIADLLAHQARLGRVRKVAPATFVVIPTSMSRSTRRRCLRWHEQLAEFRELTRDDRWRLADAPDQPGDHPCVGSPSSDAADASEEGEPTTNGDGPRLASAEPLQRRRTNW
ncbi:MAG: hypothetical protein Q8M22_02590 [Actinomycetota bacterium]|nr:hypothetical protein [Actinomycetota bacterium]